MKRALPILLLLLALGTGAGEGGARLGFDHKEWDFGQVAAKGGKVAHTFSFTNTGDAPLVVSRVETACDCTKAEFSKKPVAPGAAGTVTITYDPKRQSGFFYKAIQVYNNSPDNRLVITIKGTVTGSKQ